MVTPPGANARALIARDGAVLSQSIVRQYPLVVESAEGCIVRDIDGNEYIDFNSSLAAMNVGHGHPRIIGAIRGQIDKILHYSLTESYCQSVVYLAEQICKIVPGAFRKRVFYTSSGSEAVETALKMLKWHTRKQLFLAYANAFHGETIGALSLSASKLVRRRHFFPLMPGVVHVPYPYCFRCPFKRSLENCDFFCIEYIEECVLEKYAPPENVAAFFVEPIQSEGYIVPPEGYFKRLKKILDEHRISMVDDESQTGIGRTGRWFAIEHWDVEPETVCLSSAAASGLPFGATVSRTDLMDWEECSHANTLGGNQMACAVGLAVLETIRQEHLLENSARQGNYLLKRLREMKEEHEIIGDVRGKGLMIGVEIVESRRCNSPQSDDAANLVKKCFRKGLLLATCGRSSVRIAPPLITTRELVEAALEILEVAIKEVMHEKRN